jgi:hypothetical protein
MKTIFSIFILFFALLSCNSSKNKNQDQNQNQTKSAEIDAKYKVLKRINIPGDGGWDYVAFDTVNRRLLALHSHMI